MSATANLGSRRTSTPSGAATGWRDDPDVQLMHRVKGGDDDAFAILQEQYAPRVFGYFCKQLRDRAEAEDLTQEVFLRLYRSRSSYQARAKFATWIFHISQNVARNAHRSRRRRPCINFDPETAARRGLLEATTSNSDTTPSHSLERAELAGQVRAAVASLARRQRSAVELHQFHDRTYAEVAEDLSMTPKAAKSLLYRARNQLREMLLPVVS